MIKVKFTSASSEWPYQRQTPGETGRWGDCQFLINGPDEACDFWVVYDDLPAGQTALCPPHNTLLITAEPPSVKDYPPRFIRQFGAVVTCNRQIRAPRVFYSQSSLPWHVGRRSRGHLNLGFSKNYDELSALRTFEKKRLISVITSAKAYTRGHRQRIAFVSRLKQHFGERLDVFGRGIHEVEDKWDALADYRYHLALENCSVPDYWTEKLSDAYLAGALPIYYGCPNLADYFSPRAFIPITYDLDRAIARIEQTLKEDPYTELLPEILRARQLVLDTYNLFPRLHSLVHQLAQAEPALPVTIQPAASYISRLALAGDKMKRVIQRYI